MNRLSEIRERDKKATKGPWKCTGHIQGCAIVFTATAKPGWSDNPGPFLSSHDFQFLQESRSDIPYLLDRLERAEKVLTDIQLRGDNLSGMLAGDYFSQISEDANE